MELSCKTKAGCLSQFRSNLKLDPENLDQLLILTEVKYTDLVTVKYNVWYEYERVEIDPNGSQPPSFNIFSLEKKPHDACCLSEQ